MTAMEALFHAHCGVCAFHKRALGRNEGIKKPVPVPLLLGQEEYADPFWEIYSDPAVPPGLTVLTTALS